MFYNNSYIFPQVEPKMGTEALRGSEFARRVFSQGPGYRWSFVHCLPTPDSPRSLGRWGALDQPWQISSPWQFGFCIWEERGTFLIPCSNFAAIIPPGLALVPLVAEQSQIQQGARHCLIYSSSLPPLRNHTPTICTESVLFFPSLCWFSFSGNSKDVDYNLCTLGFGLGAAVKASALVFFIFSHPKRASPPTPWGLRQREDPGV